jgi:hypothetical protein
MDAYKTKVVFRRYTDTDIIALFPEEDAGNGWCQSYMHIGQHSAADYNGVVRATKPATHEEYDPLRRELESIGYNLTIRKRR